MEFSSNLLFTEEEFKDTKALGSYNTMQFVMRLRKDVRSALDSKEFDFEKMQASSTCVHENIHWWQHIGSNFGFIYSLSYPAFAQASIDNMKSLITDNKPYKSIIKFDKEYYSKYGKPESPDINFILNNYFDIEYAKSFALDNKNIHEILKDQRFFLNIGHCYHILWELSIHTLASSFDFNFKNLPNIMKWHENFKKLTDNKVEGFYIDSPISISPIGIRAIYEGQAMFNQMQYLASTWNNDLKIVDFENKGMLHGIYREAFDLFLHITKIPIPIRTLDPIISLFLFICDLAINPNNGFPLDIYDYDGFITKNDPGIRFINICKVVSENTNKYLNKIDKHSKEEYIYLSKTISEEIGSKCPYENIPKVLSWIQDKEVNKILIEELELKFSEINLPIRLLFSKYYRFQEDKYMYPNIFCWFGFNSTSDNSSIDFETINELFNKHHAIFTDDYDGEVKPVIFKDRKEENILESFNSFYKYNILYDLIMKWVNEDGDFKLDYNWLANDRSESLTPQIKGIFEDQFKIPINKIKII